MAKKTFSNDLLRDLHSESLTIDIEHHVEEVVELSALTHTEISRLETCEQIIEQGLNTFVEVGNALFEIRNNKLYRERFTTFEAYCKNRWQLKRQRAYELMDAAGVVNNLSEISDKSVLGNIGVLPVKESHAAALSKVHDDIRNRVWNMAVEQQQELGKPITAKNIQEIAMQLQHGKVPASTNERTELIKIIREKVKKASVEQISLEIKGSFLLENDLVSVWQKLHDNMLDINEAYITHISLSQAEKLGIIKKA